ncbi:MAG: hypothetical protein U9Q83_11805 [Bacteroidota bacterium]|nr:hypothetical protein [Bacteroidota bacterium]
MRKYSETKHKNKFSSTSSAKKQKKLSIGLKIGVIFSSVLK